MERVANAPAETADPSAEVGGPGSDDADAPAAPAKLRAPALFLNRELTWLEFNRRVLHQAFDTRVPLLERLKFVAILGSNIDEFFMKRIGGLKQQVGAGITELTVDGRTPHEQIVECYASVREMEAVQREALTGILDELVRHGIRIVRYEKLAEEARAALRRHFYDSIFPLMTPQAMDPAHPFPFVANLSLNFLITVRYPGEPDQSLARVKIPVGSGIPRFLAVGNTRHFVTLEDVVANNLDLLFPGMEINSCEIFRVTRNANTEGDEEEADDLLAMIESELRERRFAPIVRLEVGRGMLAPHRGMLAAELGLDQDADVFEVEGMLAMADLFEIASLPEAELRDPPHHPVDHPVLTRTRNLFHILRDAGSVLLQHPYESFSTSVERFLREAAEDPKVQAIKMTLYRTSKDSKVIGYLCDAARNGKQVTVVVELKARFDEEANIQFASHLEDFGIDVTYGIVGLKTHCKVILVVRQDYDGLRRYAHIGTGNYHAGTARLYTDVGLLTADKALARDLTELFNYLTTGYRPNREYRKLLLAPTRLKKALIERIYREAAFQAAGTPGHIRIKANALEDVDITRALYRASMAGVRIELIIRDTCRLRPGVAGLSENIRVVSVVGRFLEHARVYYFANGGDEEYFIGSADCMKRNLESRVEVVVPIEDPQLRDELRELFEAQLERNRDTWEMQPDGTCRQLGSPRMQKSCQAELIAAAQKRSKRASRLRKRHLKGFARRPLR